MASSRLTLPQSTHSQTVRHNHGHTIGQTWTSTAQKLPRYPMAYSHAFLKASRSRSRSDLSIPPDQYGGVIPGSFSIKMQSKKKPPGTQSSWHCVSCSQAKKAGVNEQPALVRYSRASTSRFVVNLIPGSACSDLFRGDLNAVLKYDILSKMCQTADIRLGMG